MITGSRDATEAMIRVAKAAVARAKEAGFEIIVGDADGIDAVVIAEADRIGAEFLVYGANNKLRHCSKDDIHNTKLAVNYMGRDDCMIDMCDLILAIWNGRSKGTLRNYRRAKSLGKEGWLKRLA